MNHADLWDDVANHLRRAGTLEFFSPQLRALRGQLAPAEIDEVYAYLRDFSQRWETEWRSEFAALLAVPENSLPKPNSAEQWSTILHSLLERGAEDAALEFCTEIGLPTWTFPPEAHHSQFADEIYPIDTEDEDGETAAAKAQRLGLTAVQEFFNTQRQRILETYENAWKQEFDR